MPQIVVLIPCFNEELTVAKVVRDFKKQLPKAKIYVYDNNSTDQTAEIALAQGAIVRKEYRQGKGHVLRSMFKEIDADVYVLVDGDDTYPAENVHELIECVTLGHADMAIGDRLTNGTYAKENKRLMHNFGNKLVRKLINLLFNASLQDIMSGYRVFNKTFIKNMPVLSGGFEIETEMSLHALDKNYLIKEIPIFYRDRPKGSFSKLNTVTDGFRVIRTLFWLFKDYKPLVFFGIGSMVLGLLGLLAGFPVIREFIETGKILRMPSAVLAVGLMVLSSLSITCGMILDTIVKQHREIYELMGLKK